MALLTQAVSKCACAENEQKIVFSLFFFRRVTARTVLLLFIVIETNFLRAAAWSQRDIRRRFGIAMPMTRLAR